MKKRLSVLLSFAMLLACFTPAAFAYAVGDVDNDGKITAGDARFALRAAVGLEDYAEGSAEFIAADVDRNGQITASDARMILRAAVGLETLTEENHRWSEWRSGGVNGGYHVRVCQDPGCGAVELGDCAYGEKMPSDPRFPGPATCTQSYAWYQRCAVCNGVKTGTDPKLDHYAKVLNPVKSVGATCLSPGLDWYECPLCGENGDTLGALGVSVPALGHSAPADFLSGDGSFRCTRCGVALTPAFHSLVNPIKRNDRIVFSCLSGRVRSGEVTASDVRITDEGKTLMALTGGTLTADEIVQDFVRDQNGAEYTAFRSKSDRFYQSYPLYYSNEVSRLTPEDVERVAVEDVNAVDFLGELPDQVYVKINANTSIPQDLTEFKALGSVTGAIKKITVTLREERLSEGKDASKTALTRATGIDIRAYAGAYEGETVDGNGFAVKKTCREITSGGAITYYFLETTEGGKTVYSPLAAKYTVDIRVDQRISLRYAFAVNADEAPEEIVNGSMDLTVRTVETDCYVFSPAE